MKIEADKAEGMPEMEAELAFPLSTKELFVTQDADSHRGGLEILALHSMPAT